MSNIDYKNIHEYIAELKKIKSTDESYLSYKEICCYYSVLSGIVATTLSCQQFNGNPEITTAIIYGIIGPYIYKEKLNLAYRKSTEDNLGKVVQDIIGNTKERIDKDEKSDILNFANDFLDEKEKQKKENLNV